MLATAARAAGAWRERTVRLGFGATLPAGARAGRDRERAGSTGSNDRSATGAIDAACAAPGCLRTPSDPERVLEHALVLDNATFRLIDVVPAWTRYLVLDFRFAAVSDEKRDGMLRLVVNQATGAMPDAVLEPDRALAGVGGGRGLRRCRTDADLPPAWERRRVLDLVAEALPSRLDATLAPFLKGLRRRLGRDQERLHAYHDDLHREAMRRLSALAEGRSGAPARGAAGRGDRARIPRQDR